MKAKLDCMGILILEVESEVEHYALDQWLQNNITQKLSDDAEAVDIELIAPYLESDDD